MTLDTAQLLDMTQAQLDELFRCSPPGAIPAGEGDGTVLLASDTEISEIAEKLVHLLFWKGKVFDPEKGELRNLILPVGVHAVVAKVYRDKSWFDGQECIVLDYSKTSLVAQHVRDEIREVAPKLYLGLVFWDQNRVLNFSLDFSQAAN